MKTGVRETLDMTMRRALRVCAVVGVLAAVSFASPSANAHHSITLTSCTPPPPESAPPTESPTSPPNPQPEPNNCVPDEGSRLVGTRNLQFHVRANSSRPIQQVDMYLLSEEEGVPSPNERGPVLSEKYPNQNQAPAAKTYQFQWNTVALTPYNGRYKILVIASTHGPHPETSRVITAERRDLRVDNPPQPIVAPRIVTKTETTVTVEWDKALEPDVLSYTLYRAPSKNAKTRPQIGAFKPILTTSALATRDSVPKGVYWYAVHVTRRSVVTPQTGISSPVSAMSQPASVTGVQQSPSGSTGGKKPATGGGGKGTTYVPRVFSRLPRLTAPSFSASRPPPVPDAPFSAYLPYDVPEGGEEVIENAPQETGSDPRAPVLPVAVGAFLVSSALALGRMPY